MNDFEQSAASIGRMWRDAEARERAASEAQDTRALPEGMGALVWLVGAVIVGVGGLAVAFF